MAVGVGGAAVAVTVGVGVEVGVGVGVVAGVAVGGAALGVWVGVGVGGCRGSLPQAMNSAAARASAAAPVELRRGLGNRATARPR